MKLTTTLVAGALVLAGCTTKNYYGEDLKPLPTTGPTSTVKRTTTTVASFGYVSEDEYLDAVRRESRSARIMFDEDLLRAGWATCEAFDKGLTALEVVTVMSENMGSDPQFDEMLIATASLATVWLCPEYVSVWSD